MSIAHQLIPIYNTTVHRKKNNVALDLMWLTVSVMIDKQQATRALKTFFLISHIYPHNIHTLVKRKKNFRGDQLDRPKSFMSYKLSNKNKGNQMLISMLNVAKTKLVFSSMNKQCDKHHLFLQKCLFCNYLSRE